ncbi:hypothetical protein TURU_055759 [Turdus rufiventris]|nr:hypothetical protein TURU_055759 [Turdus rufiventris]
MDKERKVANARHASYNQMDPIQKAVINHTFGVPLPHRRKQIISCNICQLRFNSDINIISTELGDLNEYASCFDFTISLSVKATTVLIDGEIVIQNAPID